MRILLDHGTPAPLIPFLTGHSVTKARDAGWDRLANGELLKAAEQGYRKLLEAMSRVAAHAQKSTAAVAGTPERDSLVKCFGGRGTARRDGRNGPRLTAAAETW
jgi:hypothetical protein